MNRPGLIMVEYAPINWIDRLSYRSIISSSWNWQQNIEFSIGGWLSMPVLPSGRLWEESEQRTDQGKYYDQIVAGIVPGLQPAASGEIDQMSDYRFLLRIYDQRKQYWILGTLDNPFEFSALATTADERGLNSYRIRFTAQTLHRAYGFEPEIGV